MPHRLRPHPDTRTGTWYRQPVLWLGAAVFAASLGGCVWMIVLAVQRPVVPTHVPTHAVLGVPTDNARDATGKQP